MGRVTLKFVLRTNKLNQQGKAPIYLRITANRKSRWKTTGIMIAPKHWNEGKQKVRRSHELADAYNNKLKRIWLIAEEASLDAETALEVRQAVEGGKGSFTAYFKEWIERLRRRDQYWERKKYEVTLNKLQSALGSDRIDWDDLDREALELMEGYCLDERGNNPNTTRKELSRVRRVIRRAVKDEVIGPEDNPFLTYDMPKRVPPDRRRLTRKEIKALEEANLEGERALARDAFLFSFYGGGIRFGDICRLRPEHVESGRLQYRMMKTDQPVDLPLPDPALEIANRQHGSHGGPHIFPFLEEYDTKDPVRLRRRIGSCNAQVNKHIKAAAEEAGIEAPDEVTFHVARHSFADFARRSSDDLYAVSKALGHSSLQITENYLSDFDREATDRLAEEMWGGDGDE